MTDMKAKFGQANPAQVISTAVIRAAITAPTRTGSEAFDV